MTEEAGVAVWKEKHLFTVGGSANWYHMDMSVDIPKKLEIDLPYDPSTLRHTPKGVYRYTF